MFQEAHRGPFDWQSAQNLLSSSSSRLASTAWYRSTSFTDLPVMARVPAGAEGDAPSWPPAAPASGRWGGLRVPARGHLQGPAERPLHGRPPGSRSRSYAAPYSPSAPSHRLREKTSPEKAARPATLNLGTEADPSGCRARRQLSGLPVSGATVQRRGFPGS